MGIQSDTATGSGIDIPQARRLADLISAAIAHLDARPSERTSNPDKDRQALQDRVLDERAEKEERETLLTIASAATQLAALVRPPEQVLLEVATGFTLSAALRLAVEAHIPEIIRTLSHSETARAEDEGVPVSHIARLSGVNVVKLDRILRLLATHHIFAERPPPPPVPFSSLPPSSPPPPPLQHEAHFAHTRLSAALDSGAVLRDVLDLSDAEEVEEEGKGEKVKVKETEEEKKRKRWAVKYGAEAPGAGLAALVGLLTDESMFHATALADVLLDSRTPAGSNTTSTSSSYPKSEAKTETSTLSSPTSTSASTSPPSPSPKTPAAPDQDTITVPEDTAVAAAPVPEDTAVPEDEDEEDPLRAPFSRARGLPQMTMFEWLSAPGNAHRLHRFGCAMRGMGSLTPESAILRGFDFASLPPGSTVIDVGGGVGTASLPILRAYPHLRLVVQDTEEVVRVAPGFWEKQYPEALRENRVSFQVQSFFDAQPLLLSSSSPNTSSYGGDGEENTGPAVFLLRMIMHNWPDAHCVKILARLRAACGPRTRLVLVDSILMAACRERRLSEGDGDEHERDDQSGDDVSKERRENGWKDAKVKEAPEPLLANWGTANGLAYKLDLIMLSNHNAGERTLTAFAALLARSGWAIEEVYAASESWMPQIVAVPSSIPSALSAPLSPASAPATSAAPAPAPSLSIFVEEDVGTGPVESALPAETAVKPEEIEDGKEKEKVALPAVPELVVGTGTKGAKGAETSPVGSKPDAQLSSEKKKGATEVQKTGSKDARADSRDVNSKTKNASIAKTTTKIKTKTKGEEGKKKRFSFLRALLPARGH